MRNEKAIKILNEVLETRNRELTDFEERTASYKEDKDRIGFIKLLKKGIREVERALEELKSDEYLYETVEDFEDSIGYQVTDYFKNAWDLARRTRRVLDMIVLHKEVK